MYSEKSKFASWIATGLICTVAAFPMFGSNFSGLGMLFSICGALSFLAAYANRKRENRLLSEQIEASETEQEN